MTSRERFGPASGWSRIALAGLCAVVLMLGLLARLVWLDSLPGVNGDEAWYGLWVESALRDHVWGGATPTGNLPNPFFLVPLGLVQALAEPALWVLRAPAVLAGLGFVVAGYACLRRSFGSASATIFVLLGATAPTAIAYARFGWDASETPLAAMIFLCCCLSGRILWAAAALLAAFIVHPANIFLAPVFVAFACADLRPWVASHLGGAMARHLLGIVMIAGALAAVGIALLLGSVGPGDLARPGYWARIAGLFSDFFSGVTVYDYIVGPPAAAVLHRIVAALVVVGCLVLLIGGRATRDPRATTLLVGVAVALLAFAMLVGPAGLSPHRERYAQFLIAPVLVLAALALASVCGERSAVGVWCAAALGCLALTGVWVNYFEPLRLSGGRSHATFRTAAIEPKVQAANWIEIRPVRCGKLVVHAESWWLAKPLQYLLFYRADISVEQFEEGATPAAGSCDDLVVTFAGSASDVGVASRGGPPAKTILDASGAPLIQLYAVEPTPGHGGSAPRPER